MANENNPAAITYKQLHITTNPQQQQTIPLLWDHVLTTAGPYANHQRQQVAHHNQFIQHQVAPMQCQDTSMLHQ